MSESPGRSTAAGPWTRERWEVRVAVLTLFVALYVGGAAWGIELAEDSGISPWYPPAGLSLALVILLGPRWAPLIVVADLTQWALVGGRGTFLVALAFAVAQAAIFALAGWMLRRTLRAEPPLTRLGDVALFGAIGVVGAPLLAGLAVMGIDLAFNDLPAEDFAEQVRVFFIGDAVAALAITPVLLTAGAWIQGTSLRGASPTAEGITAEDVLMAAGVLLLPPSLLVGFDDRLVFVSLLPLAWVALRRGLPAATLATFALATVSVIAYDLFDPGVELVDIQSFLLSGGALALASGAVVSERERGRARLAYLALHDDITGLPNRHRLMEALTDALAREERRNVAILVVQLRGLRQVLAGVGREALDDLLAIIADRLRSITGPDATLARLSPARFVVMLDGPGAERAEVLSDRILAELASPVELDGRELALDASIGVAYGARGAGPDAVLARADAATARAATQQGSRRVLFDATLEAEALERRDLERRLRAAIDDEALHLAFQPIVDLETEQVIDAEALARWTPPGGEPVPPNVFVPIAEDTGLILRLGRWVLREACRQAVTWPSAGGSPIGVSVNVSPMQLQDSGFVDDVRAALGEAGLPASRLRIEVTESIVLDDLPTAIARLAELRELGVTAMLDDFGTGYSSLSWVQRLPVTRLKIDRSFIAGLADHAIDHAIVTATVGLARALHLGTIAEGVETERQREILQGIGCTRMQGYLIAAPMPADQFLTWLDTHQPVRRSA